MLISIEKKLLAVVKKQTLLPKLVTTEADLVADLRFDSISIIVFLTEIEKEFGVTITLADLQALGGYKLSDIISLLKAKQD